MVLSIIAATLPGILVTPIMRNHAAGSGDLCVYMPGSSPPARGVRRIERTEQRLRMRLRSLLATSLLALLVGCATALIARPLTVMSARIGAAAMSKSQIPWWTNWKCHLR